jgi:ketosteroid isomerase-like protein
VLILTEVGLLKDTPNINQFVSDFEAKNGKINTYTKEFSIDVNSSLDYEIGEIQTDLRSYAVMFLKTKREEVSAKIEFLVIYEKTSSQIDLMAIDKMRKEWMTLCNSHQVDQLVKQLYLPDAYYYNRGRLIQGTKALSAEYSYMNAPSYSLNLTPKHIVSVTSDIVYEIGRCSGSYPLPYILVWKKQKDGKWLILMDSNY